MTGLERLVEAGGRRDCPGCGARIILGEYACGACWRTLPPTVRRRVSSTWRAVGRGEDGAIAAYLAATGEADSLLGSRLEFRTETES